MSNQKHWGTEFYGSKDAAEQQAANEAADKIREQSADQVEETVDEARESEDNKAQNPTHWGMGVYGSKNKQK